MKQWWGVCTNSEAYSSGLVSSVIYESKGPDPPNIRLRAPCDSPEGLKTVAMMFCNRRKYDGSLADHTGLGIRFSGGTPITDDPKWVSI